LLARESEPFALFVVGSDGAADAGLSTAPLTTAPPADWAGLAVAIDARQNARTRVRNRCMATLYRTTRPFRRFFLAGTSTALADAIPNTLARKICWCVAVGGTVVDRRQTTPLVHRAFMYDTL
jgi:hypothetical protein